MFAPLPNRRSLVSASALSVAAHAVVVGAIFFSLRLHPVKVFSLPGTDLGTRVELTYLPGRAPVPTPIRKSGSSPRRFPGRKSAPPRPVMARRRTPSIFRRCHILRLPNPLPLPMFLPPPQPFPIPAAAPIRLARAPYRLLLPPTPPAPSPTFLRSLMGFRAT